MSVAKNQNAVLVSVIAVITKSFVFSKCIS